MLGEKIEIIGPTFLDTIMSCPFLNSTFTGPPGHLPHNDIRLFAQRAIAQTGREHIQTDASRGHDTGL